MGRYREYDSGAERVAAWRKRREEHISTLEQKTRTAEAELERMRKVDGSRFDLDQSTPEEIFTVIKAAMSKSRFAVLKKLFHDKPPRKPKKSTPAG